MSRIFLSHSSRDLRAALALKHWLSEQEPQLANEIFLDAHPTAGLKPGVRWKRELFRQNSRCEAVICLLSAAWEASHECKTEYRTAETLGKQIICAALEDVTDTDITSEWQRCNLFGGRAPVAIDVPGGPPVEFDVVGLAQLRDAIRGAGTGPDNYVWPPQQDLGRAPYRGWDPFEDIDAGVFFGRDAAIVRGLDELRGMRNDGLKPLFVVLGPSGSGKSSFLRAGLVPRLQRDDRHFRTLGVLRPQHSPLKGDKGLAASIDSARRKLQLRGTPLGDIKKACIDDPRRVIELLTELRAAAAAQLVGDDIAAPTLVLPLDQAEELFSADADTEADQFLALLPELLADMNAADVGLIVVATIRTDRFEVMQNHPSLAEVTTVLFDELKPMPPTQFREVIVGPAERTADADQHVHLAPDLVERLLTDATEGADTLPLLSLTLARLYADYGSEGELTVSHYERMGGMRDVVNTEIAEILAANPAHKQHQLQALRTAFIPWLATINPENDQPLRRVARYADLPTDSRPLIEELITKRLMVKDNRDGETVVEVALESLLRQWDVLVGWLREERQNLKTADDIKRNSAAWTRSDHDPAWLLTGTRLADGEILAASANFSELLIDASEYLATSRHVDDERVRADEQHRQAELRGAEERARHAEAEQAAAEDHANDLRKRSHILRAVLVGTTFVAITAVVVAGIAFYETGQANAQLLRTTVSRLESEGTAMLVGARSGGDTRAFQEILAARTIAPSSDSDANGSIFDAVIKKSAEQKIIATPEGIESVGFSPDGRRVVSAGHDNTLHFWDALTGDPIGEPMSGHQKTVRSVTFSPDGHRVISGSDDGTVRVWNADNYKQVGAPMGGPDYAVNSVALSPDQHSVVSGGSDGSLRLWDADTGRPIRSSVIGHQPLVSVGFSRDGHRIVSGGADHTVRVLDADSLKEVAPPITAAQDSVNSVTFSPDGRHIACGCDTSVALWNADTSNPVGQRLAGHQNTVFTVAFSPDGHHIASGGADNTIRFWDTDTGQSIGSPLTGNQQPVTSVAFSPDGHRLVSGSLDGTIRLWDADTTTLTGHQDKVLSVAFSPDGRRLVSGSADHTIRLWDANTGTPVGGPLTGHRGEVESVAFSPDGRLIASGSDDADVRFWRADTGQPIGTPQLGHGNKVWWVAFSPDGRRVASAGADDLIGLWDSGTGAFVGQLHANQGGVVGVAFSPDGHRLVSAGQDDSIRLWDMGTRQPVRTLSGHTNTVMSVAFSPDGHRIVSGGDDDSVRLWDADSGQLLKTFNGHQGSVYSVVFSPDGRHIASGSGDNTIRLWDISGGSQIGQPLTGQRNTVYGVAFSPDGTRIASASADESIQLWPAEAASADLCSKLTTNMSAREWQLWVSPDIQYRPSCPGLPPDRG